MDRATIRRNRINSLGYIRWRRQLTALHEGKLRTVRKLSEEAKEVRKAKQQNQMRIRFSAIS